MTTATVAASEPWYRSLTATQWKTVFASNLGWMFDGYETFALILVVAWPFAICLTRRNLPRSQLLPAQSSA